MQYCPLGFFSCERQDQSLCHKLHPAAQQGPAIVTQPQQLGQLIHVCTAHPRASCRSSTALHPPPSTEHLTLHHSFFSLRICVSCFLQVHFQTATEQGDPAEDNPVQRAQRHSRLGVAYPGHGQPNQTSCT